ncbi:MAG: LEA type 2 family protein [Bacteroidales bacterium]|nr:LEA type 2 family protein [Bacteroidales bacterium]
MKKILTILLTISLIATSTSCGFRQLSSLKECDFKFQKVTGVSWAGIDFTKIGTDYNKLDVATVAKCTKAIVTKDFSLNVALNLTASNPGKQKAELTGFDYILYYENQKVGEGTSQNTSDIVIPGNGGSTVIPVSFKFDFRDLVDIKKPGESAKKAVKIIRDVTRVGKEDTDFSIKVRAHIRRGNKIVKGTYITIRG